MAKNIKNLIIFFIVAIVLTTFANAQPCPSIIDVNYQCQILTPPITCNVYDYNTTGVNVANSTYGNLTILENTGIYYTNFSSQIEDTYIITLCDGSIKKIKVTIGGENMTIDLSTNAFIILGYIAVIFITLYFAKRVEKKIKILYTLVGAEIYYFTTYLSATIFLTTNNTILVSAWALTTVLYILCIFFSFIGIGYLFGIFDKKK